MARTISVARSCLHSRGGGVGSGGRGRHNEILVARRAAHPRDRGADSVGAGSPRHPRSFLIEALSLGVVGYSLGVLVGLGLPYLSRLFVRGVDIRVSWVAAVLAFLFSCAVAVLFGAVPAYRASSLHPSEALHHE